MYPFADWKQGARAPWEKSRPYPSWCCSDAEAPACAPHPAARAGCPPPVGGGARREGGPGPRRARFRRRLCFCANFFCCGGGAIGCQWAFHAVGAGWACVQRPRRATKACPHAKVEGGGCELTLAAASACGPAKRGVGMGALCKNGVSAFPPHRHGALWGSRAMDGCGGPSGAPALAVTPARRGGGSTRERGVLAAHLLASQGDLLGSAPRV